MCFCTQPIAADVPRRQKGQSQPLHALYRLSSPRQQAFLPFHLIKNPELPRLANTRHPLGLRSEGASLQPLRELLFPRSSPTSTTSQLCLGDELRCHLLSLATLGSMKVFCQHSRGAVANLLLSALQRSCSQLTRLLIKPSFNSLSARVNSELMEIRDHVLSVFQSSVNWYLT